jgi:hypothetical protein
MAWDNPGVYRGALELLSFDITPSISLACIKSIDA